RNTNRAFPWQKTWSFKDEHVIPVWQIVKHAIESLWRDIDTTLSYNFDFRRNNWSAVVVHNIPEHRACINLGRYLCNTHASENACDEQAAICRIDHYLKQSFASLCYPRPCRFRYRTPRHRWRSQWPIPDSTLAELV